MNLYPTEVLKQMLIMQGVPSALINLLKYDQNFSFDLNMLLKTIEIDDRGKSQIITANLQKKIFLKDV